jgi:ribosomal protein S18 acetylase RimI-like enzyme
VFDEPHDARCRVRSGDRGRSTGRGLGSALTRAGIADARASGAGLTLSVIKINPALHLYKRLGFSIVNETDAVFVMQIEQQA